MATHSSILAWRIPQIEKPSRPVYRVAKSWIQWKQPHVLRLRHFSSLLKLCPSEDWAWRWCSCLGSWTLEVPSVQGHGLPQLQELWPHQSYGPSLWQLVIRRPLWLVLLLALTIQALRGILLFWFVHEALKGLPLAGSFSVVWCVRHLKGCPMHLKGWGFSVVLHVRCLKG